MSCLFLVVSSVTFAFKAKNVLESAGIPGKVEKLRDIAAKGGCGYGVKIDAQYRNAAARVLKRGNVKIIDVIECSEEKNI